MYAENRRSEQIKVWAFTNTVPVFGWERDDLAFQIRVYPRESAADLPQANQ